MSAATPQSNQSQVSVTLCKCTGGRGYQYPRDRVERTRHRTSPQSPIPQGTRYQVAVPTARGNGLSQAIYMPRTSGRRCRGERRESYIQARRHRSSTSAPRNTAASDPASPFDWSLRFGTSATPNSGSVTTTQLKSWSWRRHYDQCFHGAGSQLHQSHHHLTGWRHCRGQVCDGDGKLQRGGAGRRIGQLGSCK